MPFYRKIRPTTGLESRFGASGTFFTTGTPEPEILGKLKNYLTGDEATCFLLPAGEFLTVYQSNKPFTSWQLL
jgi:hypothetical protein